MAKVVNDTDKLTFILTDWGLERIAQALEDDSVVIMLSKIKVGDANYEYYEPTADMTKLVHPIENGEFYIIEKDLLEDKLTVSLHAVIPEDSSNYEIREVGVYENYNGEDKLFAISTQQPLLKPSIDLKYFITVDYYAFLKSANLAEIYDKIYIDPDNQMITQEDFDELMRTILFTESNMMEQINGNSRVIGLNRAQQLQDKIEENRSTFGYISNCNTYSLLLNSMTDPKSIFAYWLFNYPRKSTSLTSITDISGYGRNLNTNKNINMYNKKYIGLMPTLSLTNTDYFYMSQNDSVTEFNPNIFTSEGSPVITSNGIAREFSENDYITLPSITRVSGNNYALTFNFKLSNDEESQSIAYFSSPYSIRTYYDYSLSSFILQLGNGNEWKETIPLQVELRGNYTVRILFNDETCSLGLIENDRYTEKATRTLSFELPLNLDRLTLGRNNGDLIAFKGTMNLSFINATENGNTLYSGLTAVSVNNLSFVTEDGLADTSFSMLFALEPLKIGVDRTLIARSNYSTNSFIFEFVETAENSLKVRLFFDSSNYLTFTSGINTIPIEAHALALAYNASTQNLTAFINGKKMNITKVLTGSYPHMSNPISTLYGYTYIESYQIYANSSTNPTSLMYSSGFPYDGTDWTVNNGVVYYKNSEAAYAESGDVTAPQLYQWVWRGSIDDEYVYTETTTLTEDTQLYNEDYTLYPREGEEQKFAIQRIGNNWQMTYLNSTDNVDRGTDPVPPTLYCFKLSYPTQLIWANSSTNPTTLYSANGDVYFGSDWYIENSEIHYANDGGIATYTSIYNIPISTLPVTSYVIGPSGEIEAPINSSIGIIGIVKELISNEELKTLSLNLSAALGSNPCIKEY